MDLFTKNKDVDREILLRIDNDKELLNICNLNKYALSLCNESFFRNRLALTYPESYSIILENKPSGMKWKEYYLKIIYYVAKLAEEYNFQFVEGDPEKYYKILKEPLEYKQMYEASKNDYLDLIIYFIEESSEKYTWSDVLKWGISGAAEKGHLDLVKYFLSLIDTNIPEYKPDFLSKAINNTSLQDINMFDYLLKEGADPTAQIYSAAKRNNIKMVKYFISKRDNIDLNYTTFGSLRGSNNEISKYLISLGADDWERFLDISKQEKNDEMIKYFSEKLAL